MNPKGLKKNVDRVICGSSWNSIKLDCRVALRRICVPGNRYDSLGFRLAFLLPRTNRS